MNTSACRLALILALMALASTSARGQAARLVERAPDPHGSPRPFRDARHVPLRTSLYLELAAPPGAKAGEVDPDSVAVSLARADGRPINLLVPGRRFIAGASGWLKPKSDLAGARSLAVYIELPAPLEASTVYTVTARALAPAAGDDARTRPAESPLAGTWSFTTETPESVHRPAFVLDLSSQPVPWHGRFFSGVCNVVFCSTAVQYGPTYDLMARARTQHPRAWSYQRDFWPTGTEFRPPSPFLPNRLPNIVRERETRRIVAIERGKDQVRLRLEDVFGNAQYGIPAGRPIAEDYHPGDEVLIADGIHDATTTVRALEKPADGSGIGTIIVASFADPPGGWKIAYDGPLPAREDPDAPGLFPPGGCYLRRVRPHGTAAYYWGRLDKEFDLIHRTHGRRLMVNLADATGDLSRDGRSWTTAGDLAHWHDVAHTIAGHVIDRYGAASLDFTWSVFNEPDLGGLFWRASWDDLQRFYDYTSDAILRAFEDRGYDSNRVRIGGLELGGIFGTNLRLREFLAHCSPRATAPGALPLNAAIADARLDGKRSRRVEALCRAHGGKGSPCDLISIHSYNRSELMAAKLIVAKETALAIDADFYEKLAIDSHEACPDWLPPPDVAAADAYLGNGYFVSWCADVVHRQLLRAARDSRFAFGESILTVWPPPGNFAGLNAVTRMIHRDDNGDGKSDSTVTVPMPIFHALSLLSDLGDRYWVLPDRTAGGHVASGFASRDDRGVIRVLLYTHHAQDTQSRSNATIALALDLIGLPRGSSRVSVTEYRFDRDHNTPFRQARILRDRPARTPPGGDVAALFAPAAYSPAEVAEIERLCECHPTGARAISPDASGRLRLTTELSGNGCVFLVIEPK